MIGLPVTEGSADELLGFMTILSTFSGICLQPFLSVMVLKTMVGMFRYIFEAIFTVTFIKAIGTVLDKIRSRIYKDSRIVCFLFNSFPILIQEKCDDDLFQLIITLGKSRTQSSNTTPNTITRSI
jgi:hypothetical protein